MSMKYLLNYIDALPSNQAQHLAGTNGINRTERHATPLPRPKPEELKLLLTEAKEGLEIKNTTSDFFDTLERITNELRGMTEHSTAFLARVRKSDAPDYFNIIKHPMDLGTILKKVKAQQYKDKRAFKADLDLIWDNCLLYNTLGSHPLRKSATILRNRANHLLEFVTDPTTAPAPALHRPSSASRLHHSLSRLDALDASHVINSTAGTLHRPSRLNSEGVHSILSGSQDLGDESFLGDQTDAAFSEVAPDAESEFDDDFQDIEDEEEDESIRTRKGLVSLKSQPGGGRNLDLLRGLAANQPESSQAEESLSLSPAGLDMDLSLPSDGKRARSASPKSLRLGTPSPAPGIPAIPDAPGTLPGQGAALLARRATAAGHAGRRPKARTSSLPPVPTSIPFSERPALIRTPDSMTRFDHFSQSLFLADTSDKQALEAYNRAVASSSASQDVEASPNILPLLPFASSSTQASLDGPGSPASHASPLLGTKSRTLHPTVEAPDMLWWQGVSSDSLLRSGLPDPPFVSNAVASSSKIPIDSMEGVQSTDSTKSPKQRAVLAIKQDIDNLKKIKRLHRKMANLKGKERDLAEEPEYSESDEDVSSTGEGETNEIQDSQARQNLRRRREKGKNRLDMLDMPPDILQASNLSPRMNQQIMSAFCGTILQHTGFDDVHRSALDAITHLTTQYLANLGRAIGFYRDRFSRQLSFGTILRRSLSETALTSEDEVGPIADLARYLGKDLPANSQRTASLARRLEGAYVKELDDGAAERPQYELDESALDGSVLKDNERDPNLYASLLRILLAAEHDHLSLLDLEIPKEGVNFDASTLYSSFLRLAHPSSHPRPHDAFDIPPFSPPPAYVPLSHTDESSISSQIGLLQPFLRARKETPYKLFDDDFLPETGTDIAQQARKQLAGRPDVSPGSGRVTLGKRKRDPATTAGITQSGTAAGAGLGITSSMASPQKAAAAGQSAVGSGAQKKMKPSTNNA